MSTESELLRELFFSALGNPVCKGKVKEGELVNVRAIVCMSTSPDLFDVVACAYFKRSAMPLLCPQPSFWVQLNLLSDLMDGFGSYMFHYQSPGHVAPSPDGLSRAALSVCCIIACL